MRRFLSKEFLGKQGTFADHAFYQPKSLRSSCESNPKSRPQVYMFSLSCGTVIKNLIQRGHKIVATTSENANSYADFFLKIPPLSSHVRFSEALDSIAACLDYSIYNCVLQKET